MAASLVVFSIAALSSLALTPIVIRLAAAWGVLDTPYGARRVHTQPLPRLGGVAVFGAMAVGIFAGAVGSLGGLELFSGNARFFFGLLFGGGIIFGTGLTDDLRGLRPSTKVGAQLAAAGVVYAYGFRIDVISFGTDFQLALGWLALPATMFWIVAVTNAFNLIDGLDGLASGIAIVALTTTLAVAFTLGNVEAVLLSAALLGALVGFIRYNLSPARIFLGDSGSLYVGFMLAILSVHGSYKSATAVLMLIPLFALAIPLLDTSLAVFRRWLRGVPLSQADGRHIHHRLLAAGFTHRHAVLLLHGAATLLAVLGVSLAFAPPPAIASIAAAGGGVTLFVLLWGLGRLQYHEFSEAGTALLTGFGRLRGIIRDQISAKDLGEEVRRASSIEEVSAVLEDNAGTFDFLHMEVCRESSPGPKPLLLFNGSVARAWKLEYPVMPHDFVQGDDYVLRIWCDPRRGAGSYGAERVAQTLAPVIEKRLVEFGAATPAGKIQGGPLKAGRDFDETGERGSLAERLPAAARVGGGLRPSA